MTIWRQGWVIFCLQKAIHKSINEEDIVDGLLAAKKSGVNVSIRAENPHMLSPHLLKICHKSPFVWSPITIIDKRIIWYGVPVINTSFISENQALPINFWYVVRFEGEKTADTITSLLEMHKYQNFLPKTSSSEDNSFSSFIIKSNIKCKECNAKMVLRKGKSHFLGCSNYPSCKNTRLLDKSLVESYILQNNLKCVEDGYPLIAAISKYGIFARCTNPLNSHCYSLDNI